MIFDFKMSFVKEDIPDSFYEVRPGYFVWVDGHCFFSGEGKVGREFAHAIDDYLVKNRSIAPADLGGNFSVVCISIPDQKIEVISDRWGTRPLYWHNEGGHFIIGNEYWEIFKVLPSAKISPEAAIELLTFNYVLGERTLIEQISEISYSRHLIFQCNKADEKVEIVQDRKYWQYDVVPQAISGEDIISELGSILEQVGQRQAQVIRAMGVERVGLSLTGGVDSRTMAYMFHRNNIPFTCFTSRGIGGENDASFRIAQLLDVPHIFIPQWTTVCDEPIESLFWHMAPTTMIYNNHTMSLKATGPWGVDGFWAGHMGDPVRGGQVKLRDYCMAKKGREALSKYEAKKHTVMPPSLIASFLSKEHAELSTFGQRHMAELSLAAKVTHAVSAVAYMDFSQRQRRFMARDYSLLTCFGPTTLPFMDSALWDFYAKVPFEWQINFPAFISALHQCLFVGEYKCLSTVPINGKLSHVTRYPWFETVKSSAVSLLRGRMKKVGSVFHRGRSVPKIKAENQLLMTKMYNGLLKRLPALEWLCDIDQVRETFKPNEDGMFERDCRSLYTLSRVCARQQGME